MFKIRFLIQFFFIGFYSFSQTVYSSFSWLTLSPLSLTESPYFTTDSCGNITFTIQSSQDFVYHPVGSPYNTDGIIFPADISIPETYIDISITFNQQINNLKIRLIDLDENANNYADPEEFISQISPSPNLVTSLYLPVNSIFFNGGIITPNDNDLTSDNNDASGWVSWSGLLSSVSFRYNRPGSLYGLIIDSIQFDCPTEQNIELNSLLEMPNVFTANGDGRNDFFQPVVAKNIVDANWIILNRWGNIVFETNNLNLGWNGKSNEKECSEGVYFWKLDYTEITGNANTKHGFFHLIR